MHFPQTWTAWKFAMFKNFIHITFKTVETYFFVPEPL